MKKHMVLMALLIAGISAAFSAVTVKLGDLYYSLYSTTAEVIKDQSGEGTNYALLDTVIIPASVTYNDVTYPVTSINQTAFRNCSALKVVSVPESVTSVGSNAFNGCTALDSVAWNAVNCTSSYVSNTHPFYTTASYSPVTKFTFGDGVQTIPPYLCDRMNKLDTIALPATVTNIGQSAFGTCTRLRHIVLPEGLATVGSSVFSGCSSLKTINIPASLTSISNYFCQGCSSLTGITIPEGVTYIGKQAFAGTGLTEITIPSTVSQMGGASFQGCNSLDSVAWNAVNCTTEFVTNTHPFYTTAAYSPVTKFTFGADVQTIPPYLCDNMNKLDTIAIPATVTNIGQGAFGRCTGLHHILLPEGLTTVGSSVFSDCSNLETVNIPGSLTSISNYFCQGCSSLTGITIPEGVTYIGRQAFAGTGLTEITIPRTVSQMGGASFQGCSSLTKVVWNAENCTTSFATNTHPFYVVASTSPVTSFSFGENVRTIPQYLCYNMSRLDSIVIPATVTNIGNGAFGYCTSLMKIYNYAVTPQTVNANVFLNVDKDACSLYVPAASLYDYQNANVWREFFGIYPMNPDTPTGLLPATDGVSAPRKIIRDGQVYIIRDGRTYTVTGIEVKI